MGSRLQSSTSASSRPRGGRRRRTTTRSEERPLPAAPRRTRRLHLTRSPLEPASLVRLGAAAIALTLLTLALGWPLSTGPPPAVDLAFSSRSTAPLGTTEQAIAAAVGRVGHLWVVAAIAAVVAILAHRRSGRWDVALLLLTVLGGATVMTGLTKVVLGRARPDGADVETLSAAFPSGHAVRGAAVLGLVAYLVRLWSRRRTVRVLAIPAAVAVVLLNGGARVVLGVHWPSDVLVGILLGTAWLLISWWVLQPEAVGPEPRRHDPAD